MLFTDTNLQDDTDVLPTDWSTARRIGIHCLKHGLFVNPGDKFSVSTAHSYEDVEQSLDIFDRALAELSST